MALDIEDFGKNASWVWILSLHFSQETLGYELKDKIKSEKYERQAYHISYVMRERDKTWESGGLKLFAEIWGMHADAGGDDFVTNRNHGGRSKSALHLGLSALCNRN